LIKKKENNVNAGEEVVGVPVNPDLNKKEPENPYGSKYQKIP
jgi:hypothetical protein